MTEREEELRSKAEQLARLLAEFALDLPSGHPLRLAAHGKGLITTAYFRQLVETEVGDQLQDAVFLRMVELLPPAGDSLFVDVRRWLAPLAGVETGADDASLATKELMRLMAAACQDRNIPTQQLLRRLEGHDARGTGEVGVASFVHVLQEIGLGDTSLNVNPVVVLRRAVGSTTTVPYKKWLREHMPPIVLQPPVVPAKQAKPKADTLLHPPTVTLDAIPDGLVPLVPAPPDDGDALILQKRDVWNFCRQLIHEAAADAATQAEVRRGCRHTQNKFKSRPVIHNVLTAQERFSHSFSSLVAQSLVVCCSSLNRLLLLDYGHCLHQIDLLSGAQLHPVHIGKPIPYINSPVIAIALDDALGRLGTLDSKWTLSLWEMQRSASALTNSPFGIAVAKRKLPVEISLCQAALSSYEFRQYSSVGYGPMLLLFLDTPARCYCLNVSWIGKLVFFDAFGLGTLRVLDIGGQPSDISVRVGPPGQWVLSAGVARRGLWSLCEGSSKGDKRGLINRNLLEENLRTIGVADGEGQKICESVAEGDKCNFRVLCNDIDHVRYPPFMAQQPPRAKRLSPEVQSHLSVLLHGIVAVDALFEIATLEHRGLILCTAGGLSSVWFIRLLDGGVLGSINHQCDSARHIADSRSPRMPPILHIAASRDLAFTGGRTTSDSCVNVWSLSEVPGMVPQTPSLILSLQETASSPVTCLGFLPVSQSVVDARLDGKVHIWDMTRFTDDLHDPSEQPHSALVGGHAQPVLLHESLPPGSIAPALTLPKHLTGFVSANRLPVVRLCVPAAFYAKYDLILALSRSSPTLRFDHANGKSAQPAPAGSGPAVLLCWSLVRSRVHVPAIIMNLPGVSSVLEPEVEQRANAAFERGLADVQGTVRHRLEATLDRVTKPQTRHARFARRSAIRGCLDFTWKAPAMPEKLWKDAWTSWTPSGAHLRGLSCYELDALSLNGVGNETWVPPNSSCNFLQLRWEKKIRGACMQSQILPGKGEQGLLVSAIRKASMNSIAVMGCACSVTLDQPKVRDGMNAAGWTGTLVLSRGELGAGIAGVWSPTQGMDPTNYKMQWDGKRWLTKLVRELRRLKMLDSHGNTILLPLPSAKVASTSAAPLLNPRKDGCLVIPIGIYSTQTSDAPTLYTHLREAVLLPFGFALDDFLASVSGTTAGRKSMLATVNVGKQFSKCVTDSGGPSHANVEGALIQLGMTATTCSIFMSYLQDRFSPDCGKELMLAVSERLTSAYATPALAAVRDMIGVRAGGSALVHMLEMVPGNDWKGDAHSADTMEKLLSIWGIPVCQGNRGGLIDGVPVCEGNSFHFVSGVFKVAMLEKPSGSPMYSLASIARCLYGEDEVAQAIYHKNKRQPILAVLERLDANNTGMVELAELQIALQESCAHRIVRRLASLSMEKELYEEGVPEFIVQAPPPGQARYKNLLKALDTLMVAPENVPSKVFEQIATSVTQGRMTRLLSLFCGGLMVPFNAPTDDNPIPLYEPSGQDWWSPHGWTGLPGVHIAVRSPRLYGHDAIAIDDLKVAVRSVIGFTISEEHLSAMVDSLNPENHPNISTTRFLQQLHRCRKDCVEALLDKLSAATTSAPELLEIFTACAAHSTMSVEAFLPRMRSSLPDLVGPQWSLLLEAFRAPMGGSIHLVTKDLLQAIVRRPPQTPLRSQPHRPGAPRDVGGDGFNRDLLMLVYGARKEILEACEQADGSTGFGTVTWDAFEAAVAHARVILETSEAQELKGIVDFRHDGQIPYRLALHRIGLNLGVPSEFPRTTRRQEPLPATADVPDLWRVVARKKVDHGLQIRSIFSALVEAPGASSDTISRRMFIDAFRRLGITTGVSRTSGVSEATPLATGTLLPDGSPALLPPIGPPDGPSASRLSTSRDLVSIAFRQLDTQNLGRVALADIERCVYRAEEQLAAREESLELAIAARITAEADDEARRNESQTSTGHVLRRSLTGSRGLFLRYLPQDLLPFLGNPPDTNLATAIVLVAADLEAQELTAFDAFACLDSSQAGFLRVEEFCPNLTAAIPSVSLEQARRIFELLHSLPTRGSDDRSFRNPGGVTFPQFERAFPLCTPLRPDVTTVGEELGSILTSENVPWATSKQLWYDSIADRVVQHFTAQGISPEIAFRGMDVAGTGTLVEADIIRAAHDLRFGISPAEASLLYNIMVTLPGGPTYRGFVAALRDAYDRAHVQERRAAGILSEEHAHPHNVAESEPLETVSRRLHDVDPNLRRVFNHFAIDGKLPRSALRDVVHHLGLRMDRIQLGTLWKALDPRDSGVVDSKKWEQTFRTTQLADVRWGTIFSRLEEACVSRGVPLHDLLSDMDRDRSNVLSPVVARRIFGKVGVAASPREVDEWLEAVTQCNAQGAPKINIAHAAAITTSRAHGGRLLAARRLQGYLRTIGIPAEHALRIILQGFYQDDFANATISRADIIMGLAGLGVPTTASDLEQLLDFLDPEAQDQIAPELFLRMVSPDPAAARRKLEEKLPAEEREVLLPPNPSASQVRIALAKAGVLDDGDAPAAEADLLVLALTAGGGPADTVAAQTWFDEPILHGARAAARSLRRRRRGRWLLNVPSHKTGKGSSASVDFIQSALESRAENLLRKTLDAVKWDVSVLAATLPPSPPLLSLHYFNAALRPIGIHFGLEDATAIQQAYKAHGLVNADYFVDVQQFLAVVSQIHSAEPGARIRPAEENLQGYPERLLDKIRARFEATGLDLIRSVVMRRPVIGIAQGTDGSAESRSHVVAVHQLEEALSAHPISLSHKEVVDFVRMHAQKCTTAEGMIDLKRVAAVVAPPATVPGFSAEDMRWMKEMQCWLHATFPDSASAYAYIDHGQQGAVSFTDFCDAIMRVMTGSLPLQSDFVGVRLLDVGNTNEEVLRAGGGGAGLVRREQLKYNPDTYYGLQVLDPAQRQVCASACQKLFVGLTKPPADARKRQLRLISYGDFHRFWQQGVKVLSPDAKPSKGKNVAHIADYWAAELAAMFTAKGENVASIVAGLCKGIFPGQVSGCDLVAKVMEVLCLRFAPLLLSKLRDEPLTATEKIALLHTQLGALHSQDLSYPLVVKLRQQAERLVHCVMRAPVNSMAPLAAGPGDLITHWAVDAASFASYCSRAVAGTGGTARYAIGTPIQMKADLAHTCYERCNVFGNAMEQAHSLALAVMSMQTSTNADIYSSLVGLRCLALRLQKLQSLLVDLQMMSLGHVTERIFLSQLGALDCFPAPPPKPKRTAAEHAAESLIRHLTVLQQLHLDDLKIDYRTYENEDIERRCYEASHPQVCWIIVETVDVGRPGRVANTITGFARFSAQPSKVIFRLDGNVDYSIRISEVIQGNAELQQAQDQGWLLRSPNVTADNLTVFLEKLRPGDTLIFRGHHVLNLLAEVVPKTNVTEAIAIEAALSALLSGRSGEHFEQFLKPEERSAAWALSKARISYFQGWWCRGDYVLVKEPLKQDGWSSLFDVVRSIGGLSRWWFSGGMYFYKLLCRQILSLMLVMHQQGVVARHLRLKDFQISRDGQELRLHSLRFASLKESAETMLPSLQGCRNEPLAPEFFAKGASAATCAIAVDSWVFGSLAFHLFFGTPAPCYQNQVQSFYARHSGCKWAGAKSFSIPGSLPAHFCYSPLAGVPPAHRILLRAAVDKCSTLAAPPRMEAAPGPLVTALWSHSALVPPLPIAYRKVPETVLEDTAKSADARPQNEEELADSSLDVPATDPKHKDCSDTKEKDSAEHETRTVVVPEGHLLDLVFACLVVDQKKRPSLQQMLVSTVFDVESAENGGWHLAMFKPQLETFVRGWVQGGLAAKSADLEHMLRVMCAYLFTRKCLAEAQQKEFGFALSQIEDVLLSTGENAARSVLQHNLLYYVKFIVMRTKDHNPKLLTRFSTTIGMLLENLSSCNANLGIDADIIIDLVIAGLCGRELQLSGRDAPAHFCTRFFLRPLSWEPNNATCDVIDEMWRHEAAEINHFGVATYLAFQNHHRYLLSLLEDSCIPDMVMGTPRPLQPALKKREVRGPTYLRALAEVAENHYRYVQGTSPIATRSAIQHSRRLLATRDPEQWLALADMWIPDAYLSLLGSPDAYIMEEVVLFFAEIERILLPPGDHCHAGLDCPACSRFRPHHSARGVHLLSGLAMSPLLHLELKKIVVTLLVDVAMAYGLPPQRQAFGTLVLLLQMQRPRSDPLTTEFQPYIRTELVNALHSPTPALVHALYCYPAALALLGLSRSDVCQPICLQNVADQGWAWLRRTQESTRIAHAAGTNWMAVLPLVAWARHMAQLDGLPDLVTAVDVLRAIYQEAFIHAELPYLPEPRDSGGLPPATWEQGAAADDPDREARIAGPMRYMVEFIGFIELIFLRFGPSPVKTSVAVFVNELENKGLVETPWYFQLLHLFGTLTAQKAPWLRASAPGNDKLRLRVFGLDPPAPTLAAKELHPSAWNVARWYTELHEMGLGRAFAYAMREALSSKRVVMRRPKWTATMLTLIRVVWQNIISVPSAAKTTASDGLRADILVHALVDQGLLSFLIGDCIASDIGDSLSNVGTSLRHDDRVSALLDLRGAAILLLEDLAQKGIQHSVLVQSLLSQLSRHFIDSQRSLLFSMVPRLQASAAKLFRVLLSLRAPGLDVMLQQLGIPAEVQKIAGDESDLPHLLHSEETQESGAHPLALHRVQVGELVGGFKGAKPKSVLFPNATTAPKSRAKSKPKTAVVVPRR